MDDLQFGSAIRAIRRKRGLRQADVARLSDVSHGTVSLIERGHCQQLSLQTVRRVAAALDVRAELVPRWRGGELDRLLNRRHSILAERFAGFVMSNPGWAVAAEVSFSIYGERGVVDQLAWHSASAHLIVIELKTALVDVNEMLGTLDRKRRLARAIAADRGWRPAAVSVWLIVEDAHTNRRHAAEHQALLRGRFPLDGRQLRSTLLRPTGETFGMAFWPASNPGSTRPRHRLTPASSQPPPDSSVSR